MRYRVEKWNWNTGNKVADYGTGYSESEVKAIVKGFKLNADCSDNYMASFDRKNSQFCYYVAKAPECINSKGFWEK